MNPDSVTLKNTETEPQKYIIGINHGFECINIRRVPRKVFEHEAEG